MRRFLTYTLGLFITTVLILTSLNVVGALMQPPALSIFVPQHCSPHPCWYGLQPGKTSIQQARTILDSSAEPVGNDIFQLCPDGNGACWKVTVTASGRDPDSALDNIDLNASKQQLRLGDLIALYGSPISGTLCYIITPTNGGITEDVPRPLMVGNISFKGHVQVFVYNPNDPKAQRFDPNMIVNQINFKSLPDQTAPRWRGFESVSKLYCGR
ncbi:MAG: hypothetical protein KF716_08600 [Anaerolineae bacterium]|nr:hypothetical protein [Anaerolineae bacterium]